METETIALVTFVMITTFTPGPNNISSASMGILYGYWRSLDYIMGISLGFFMMLTLSGWLSVFLLESIPAFEPTLRVVGAVYILWLAWHTLRASYTFETEDQKPLGFLQGFLLQVLNVKVIVYVLTLYGTFLAGKITSPVVLALSALGFAFVGFTSLSVWTLFGAGIRKYLEKKWVKRLLNILLALLLVYTAVELSGVLDSLS